jgi:CHAD domain-containing protein
LRLVRDNLGKKVYQRENDCFRDLGRRLSGARDATVMGETLAGLVAEGVSDRIQRAAEIAIEQFEARSEEAAAAVVGDDILDELEQARQRGAAWPLEGLTAQGLGAGLKRIYSRGRDALATLDDEPDGENFHEWRKRVKYLWYSVRLLTPAWPQVLEPWADELHDLASLLGKHHDLVVLRQTLQEDTDLALRADTRKALLPHLEQKLAAREALALPLGAKLYAEKPKAFARRLAAYVAEARRAVRQAGEG